MYAISIEADESIQLTNSILISDSAHQTFVLGGSTNQSHIAHNTFVGGTGIYCNPNSFAARTFDSNIFYNVPSIPPSCQYQYNLSVLSVGLTGTGNITGDPMFKDSANDDFHLKPGSAAIDTANPGDVFTGHDFDGTQRPQGTHSDIGALEYVPSP
jgi:hypothetical protein